MVLVMRVCWAAIAAGQQGAAQRLQQQAEEQRNTVSGPMGEGCRISGTLGQQEHRAKLQEQACKCTGKVC
jgi:hypothetical protein